MNSGVEQETARADREHVGAVADHDERAHARLQDPVEALAQLRARRHEAQGEHHGFRSRWRADGRYLSVLGTSVPEARCRPDSGFGTSVVHGGRRPGARLDAPRTSCADGGASASREPEARRFVEPAVELRHRADLTAEADLTDRDRARDDRGAFAGRPRPRARARGRAPVSVTRRPPATLAYTSAFAGLTPPCWSSTASSIARRAGSMPAAERRGIGAAVGHHATPGPRRASGACPRAPPPPRSRARRRADRRGSAPTRRGRRRGRARSSRTARARRCCRTGASSACSMRSA